MAKKTKWLYRTKPSKQRATTQNEWKPCTNAQREKLDRMRPNKYEFKENKPPEPTPNMIAKKENE